MLVNEHLYTYITFFFQETLLQAKEGLALLPASATIGASHAQLCEDPVIVTDLHGADTHEELENDPIEIIGKFLTSAFKLLKCHLPDLLTMMHSGHGVLQPVSLCYVFDKYALFQVVECVMVSILYVQVVHKLKAVHSNQRDLLILLWSEYNGKKLAPFEIYRCHKGTTEEDLSLFFSRIQQFRYVSN